MNKKVIYLILSAIVLATFYFGFMNYRNNIDRLLTRFNSQIKEGKFEQLYEESSDSFHLNVTKEEFVHRMKIAVGKLKNLDANLDFKTEKQIEWEYFGKDEYDDSTQFRRIQKLEKDNVSAVILVYWENEGVFPKFNNFAVIVGNEHSQKYGTQSIYHK